MFKGLKSKLEDEAKKLQATVSQYGENIANQVRSNASDAGSDISGRGRKFFESAFNSANQDPQQSGTKQQRRDSTDLGESIIDLDADGSLLDESAVTSAVRQRHPSTASVESNESSFSALQLPPHPQSNSSAAFGLDTISSDVESNAGSVADLSSLENVSSDKITSIFQRLQGRAVDYKQKYRDLAKAYQEIERENEKCRMVLASTQDKALKRIAKLKEEKRELKEQCREAEEREEKLIAANAKIQKLQDLLSKCKDEITANRERIVALGEENKQLKEAHGGGEQSVERVSAEWKGRFDRQEEEWTQRMAACEEKAAIAIATSKAETHSAIQQKDQELERWIEKCHSLEKQDVDANVRWQEKVESLQKDIVALEQEKADMVQKLSQAKQEGVKLVKESEEKRHGDILAAEMRKKDEEWGKRVKELEEQMQLSVEESDLQRKTSVAEHERDLVRLRERIGELEKENARLISQSCKQKEQLAQQSEDLHKLRAIMQEEEQSAETQNQLVQLRANLAEKEAEISAHKAEFGQKIAEITRLSAEVEMHRSAAAESQEALRGRMQELGRELTERETELENVRGRLAEVEEENSLLCTQLDEQKAKDGKREQEILQLTATLQRATEHEAQIVSQHSQEEQAIHVGLKASLAQKEAECEELRAKLEASACEKAHLSETMKGTIEEMETNAAQIASLKSQIEAQNDAANSIRAQNEARTLQLSDELAKMETQNGQLRNQLEAMEREKAANPLQDQQRLEAVERELAEKQTQLDSVREELARAEQKSAKLSEECAQLRNGSAEKEAELQQRANSQFEALRQEIEECWGTKLAELRNELDDSESARAEFERRCVDLTKRSEDGERRVLELNDSVDMLKRAMEEREQQLERRMADSKMDVQKQVDLLLAEKERITARNSELESQIAAHLDQEKLRQSELSAEFEKERERLEQEAADIRQQLDQIRLEHSKEQEEKTLLVAKFERELEELRQGLNTVEKVSKAESNEWREKVNAVEEEKTILSLELKTSQLELKKAREMETQIRGKASEIERLEAQLQSASAESDDAQERAKALEKRLTEDEEAHRREVAGARREWERSKQKAMADLQSEIRQIYHDINEKDCELAATHADISRLSDELKALKMDQEQQQRGIGTEKQFSRDGETTVDLDEVLELRRQLQEREEEVQRFRLGTPQQQANGTVSPSRKREIRSQLSIGSDHLNFAEPTEAEYLRNVLYRYMTERETLGRESVTLAKVIGTVCKFPPDQLSLVLRREEARCQGWLPEILPASSSAAVQLVQRHVSSAVSAVRRLDYDRM